jgi:hypothetical protein
VFFQKKLFFSNPASSAGSSGSDPERNEYSGVGITQLKKNLSYSRGIIEVSLFYGVQNA